MKFKKYHLGRLVEVAFLEVVLILAGQCCRSQRGRGRRGGGGGELPYTRPRALVPVPIHQAQVPHNQGNSHDQWGPPPPPYPNQSFHQTYNPSHHSNWHMPQTPEPLAYPRSNYPPITSNLTPFYSVPTPALYPSAVFNQGNNVQENNHQHYNYFNPYPNQRKHVSHVSSVPNKQTTYGNHPFNQGFEPFTPQRHFPANPTNNNNATMSSAVPRPVEVKDLFDVLVLGSPTSSDNCSDSSTRTQQPQQQPNNNNNNLNTTDNDDGFYLPLDSSPGPDLFIDEIEVVIKTEDTDICSNTSMN